MADFFGDAPAPVARPLAQEDMQILHLLRKLSPEAARKPWTSWSSRFAARRPTAAPRERDARESETG